MDLFMACVDTVIIRLIRRWHRNEIMCYLLSNKGCWYLLPGGGGVGGDRSSVDHG